MLQAGRGPGTGLYVEEDIRPREPSPPSARRPSEVLDAMPWPRESSCTRGWT